MKIKILIAIIIAVAGFSFFGAEDAYANKSVSSEAACGEVGGRWEQNSKGPDKCIIMSYDSKDKCEAAKGSWIDVGSYATGGYVKRCEIKVNGSGNPITSIPTTRPADTQSECLGAGGSWQWMATIEENRCITPLFDSKDSCKAADGGEWHQYYDGSSMAGYCELLLKRDGSLATKFSKPSTYTNQDCNILPDFICDAKDEKDLGKSAIWQIVLFLIQIMTAGVGLLALAGIVYGSVMYSSAGGNPEQVKKARTIILNVVIGVIAYALMFSLLQWIVPGGIFN